MPERQRQRSGSRGRGRAPLATPPSSRRVRVKVKPSDEQVYAAPRLFEEMAATAEPDDMASFYHGLTHDLGLRFFQRAPLPTRQFQSSGRRAF